MSYGKSQHSRQQHQSSYKMLRADYELRKQNERTSKPSSAIW